MKNLKRTTVLVLIFTATTIVHRAWAQDWPQWRGKNRDAKATGFEAPETWPDDLNRRWTVNVGDGDATPALVGERLYVFSLIQGNEVLRCLNAETGKELWQEAYPAVGASGPARGHAGPRSSPCVANGKVVTLGVRGTLSCWDAESGKVLWRKNDFSGSWPRFFTSSSPIIVDQTCIAQLGDEREGGIIAYDLATGDPKWRWTGDGTAYASPILQTVNGTRLITALTANNVVGIEAASGELLWKTAFEPQGRYNDNAATPIAGGSMVIYTGANRGATTVRLEKAGDEIVAREVWSNPDHSPKFSTPIFKNGWIYGLAQSGDLFCVNARNGETAWTHSLVRRGDFGSLVDAGTVVIALTPSAELTVFEPSADQYKQLAAYKVADSDTYAYPVVSSNGIYIKDQNSVTLWALK